MQTFEEYFETKTAIHEHWLQMTEEEKAEKKNEPLISDKTGPGKGKPFDKLGSTEHLAAMQHHSSKFNELKKSKDHSEHIQKAGIDYHSKMYNFHKTALGK